MPQLKKQAEACRLKDDWCLAFSYINFEGEKMKISYFLCIIANVALVVLGQVLFKIGVSKEGMTFSAAGILKIITNGYIIFGLLTYVFATFIWFYVLDNVNLSKAYPAQSLCYVFMAVVSVLYFKEKISIYGIIGLVLIISGVIFSVRA